MVSRAASPSLPRDQGRGEPGRRGGGKGGGRGGKAEGGREGGRAGEAGRGGEAGREGGKEMGRGREGLRLGVNRGVRRMVGHNGEQIDEPCQWAENHLPSNCGVNCCVSQSTAAEYSTLLS